MPNKKNVDAVKELVEKIKKASSIVLINYEGITVAEDTNLRRKMRTAGVEYLVAKNRLFKIALKEAGVDDDFTKDLEETTSFAFSYGDAVAGAKVAFEVMTEIRKTKKEYFVIKSAVLTGKRINAAGVEALAKLPPKEVLVAKLLGSLNAPITGLVSVMNGPIRGLACALNAIKDKK